MAVIVKLGDQYMKSRYATTPDINAARVFRNAGPAKNSVKPGRYAKDAVTPEYVEVVIVEKDLYERMRNNHEAFHPLENQNPEVAE